jgi:hypothetical protein
MNDDKRTESVDDAEPEYSLSDMLKYLDKQWHPGATQTAAKLRELAAENAQLRAMLIQKETDAANRALEDAASLCEARADAGVASGSWDGGISAWDAAQILAAAIRGMVRT